MSIAIDQCVAMAELCSSWITLSGVVSAVRHVDQQMVNNSFLFLACNFSVCALLCTSFTYSSIRTPTRDAPDKFDPLEMWREEFIHVFSHLPVARTSLHYQYLNQFGMCISTIVFHSISRTFAPYHLWLAVTFTFIDSFDFKIKMWDSRHDATTYSPHSFPHYFVLVYLFYDMCSWLLALLQQRFVYSEWNSRECRIRIDFFLRTKPFPTWKTLRVASAKYYRNVSRMLSRFATVKIIVRFLFFFVFIRAELKLFSKRRKKLTSRNINWKWHLIGA